MALADVPSPRSPTTGAPPHHTKMPGRTGQWRLKVRTIRPGRHTWKKPEKNQNKPETENREQNHGPFHYCAAHVRPLSPDVPTRTKHAVLSGTTQNPMTLSAPVPKTPWYGHSQSPSHARGDCLDLCSCVHLHTGTCNWRSGILVSELPFGGGLVMNGGVPDPSPPTLARQQGS
jgi:hypothetical protein